MLFTIITVCYNPGKSLEKTVKSLIAQTFNNFEFIIIDGESTDGTKSKLIEYESLNFSSYHWISEKDSGIYNAMNKGIFLAKGKYILFLNSDDTYDKDFLLSLSNEIIKNPNKDIYFGDTLFVSENESHVAESRLEMLFNTMTISHISMAVSRKVFNDIGVFSEEYKVASDWDFTLRAYLAGYVFHKYVGCFTYFKTGGISADKNNYIHELERISKINLFNTLNLTLAEIEELYNISDLSYNRQHELFDKILNNKTTTLFLKSYNNYLLKEYTLSSNRFLNSKLWRIRNLLLKLKNIFKRK